ncbi:MAG: hypothetical protein QXP97_01605 [Desulfurococcus sp.]|uniref:hypothetical protein n=1 Tax=Desulfurococcus sp. TaxID=51678 RepID=UPI00316591D6
MGETIDSIWPCKCWFCRLFTRRVLGYFIKRDLQELGYTGMAGRGGGVVASNELDVAKELKALKDGLEELKRSLAEVKAVIADLTGPFSLYKPPTETLQQQAPSPQPQSASESRGVSTGEERRSGVVKESEFATEKPGERGGQVVREAGGGFERVLSELGRVVREERTRMTSYSMKRLIGLIKTVYEIRQIYPRESVESIITVLEKLSIISDKELELLKASMDLVEGNIRQNMSTEETTLLMYMLLKNLGVRDEELEEEATRAVLQALMVKRMGARKESASDSGESSKGDSDKWASQQQ